MKKRSNPWISYWVLQILTAFSVISLLAACGGGAAALIAGVGSGGSGLAEGTVTGFGSVIVDGTEYDDASADVQQDDGAGNAVNAELKLGQRVRLVLAETGKVQTAAILPQLSGPVTTAQDGSGTFRIMGQWVRLSGSAADLTQGTTAVLSGFPAGRVALADEVEAHGTWVYDSALASQVLIASRVEKLATATDPVQLSGIVQSVSGATLRLNSPAGLQLQGTLPTALTAGHLVSAWVKRSDYQAVAPNFTSVMSAQRVLDNSLTSDAVSDRALKIAGQAGNYDPVSRTLVVQGTAVKIPASLGVDDAYLAGGKFVSIDVKRSGNQLLATSVNVRTAGSSGGDLGQTVSVKAVASGIDWSASTVTFSLRGVNVQVPQSMVPVACRIAMTTDDLQIEVKGQQASGTDRLLATELKCTAAGTGSGGTLPSNITIDRAGVISQVNLGSSTFRLTTAQGVITVLWDAQTFFTDPYKKHPESLSGLRVEVEGISQPGVLRARKIKPSN